ncbi:MAG: hypothetical protein ABSF00_05975 [Candidatus Bathyarchaeia archaeon]|jgi:hypothetical protein
MSLLRSILTGLLVLVAIVSIAFIGYTSLNPPLVTVTQQQFLTNTQSLYSTQTMTSLSIVTSFRTVTSATTAGFGNGYPGYGYYQNYPNNPNCSYYGCYYSPPGFASPSDLCTTSAQNGTIQCSGYLHVPSSTCTELAIPYNAPALMESTGYLYLTLFNLPSNTPPSGTWVTVTGTLNQGYSSGVLCTTNYINVATIS